MVIPPPDECQFLCVSDFARSRGGEEAVLSDQRRIIVRIHKRSLGLALTAAVLAAVVLLLAPRDTEMGIAVAAAAMLVGMFFLRRHARARLVYGHDPAPVGEDSGPEPDRKTPEADKRTMAGRTGMAGASSPRPWSPAPTPHFIGRTVDPVNAHGPVRPAGLSSGMASGSESVTRTTPPAARTSPAAAEGGNAGQG